MGKIGLLGGSFNPIHYGHLLLADSARDQFGLDQVVFIPAGTNPFKTGDMDPGRDHRLAMVELAIADNPYFSVSTIELDQPGVNYTIETIRRIKAAAPCEDYYFITGADILFEIDRWREAPVLLKSISLITTFRPGYSDAKLDERIAELIEHYGADISKLAEMEMDISSTTIRQRVKEGYSIKYLMPPAVEAYINEHGIYQATGEADAD